MYFLSLLLSLSVHFMHGISGGVVAGDEIMAVNGKILSDVTLTEGQNSLARAWSSGGVRTFKLFILPTKIFWSLVLVPNMIQNMNEPRL